MFCVKTRVLGQMVKNTSKFQNEGQDCQVSFETCWETSDGLGKAWWFRFLWPLPFLGDEDIVFSIGQWDR